MERRDAVSEFQIRFRKEETIDSIFIVRTVIDKYLCRKRGKVYCIFVDLKMPLVQ
jgi:hypothetical protein